MDGDFDMEEEHIEHQPRITYSTTLGNQRVYEKGSYNTVYTTRSGIKGMGSNSLPQQGLQTDASVVPAVYHDQIRGELISIAAEGGAYSMFPPSVLVFYC